MTTLAPALSVRYLPRASSWMHDFILILSSSLLVAAGAQISVPLPFTPVPITGQTFAVLLVGAALGSKRGAASLILYLIEGALGLPFFARRCRRIACIGRRDGRIFGRLYRRGLCHWPAGRTRSGKKREDLHHPIPRRHGHHLCLRCSVAGILSSQPKPGHYWRSASFSDRRCNQIDRRLACPACGVETGQITQPSPGMARGSFII